MRREVLYPRKQAGTRTYIPVCPPQEEKVSESEKFFGLLNSVIRGIALTFLIGTGCVVLGVLALIAG